MYGTINKLLVILCYPSVNIIIIMYQPKNAPNRMQFMTIINLLLISALACHPRGFLQIKEVQASNANQGIA
jgi:hypothetical protein